MDNIFSLPSLVRSIKRNAMEKLSNSFPKTDAKTNTIWRFSKDFKESIVFLRHRRRREAEALRFVCFSVYISFADFPSSVHFHARF